ncbi:hypothetical protein [Nocardia sp. alder85J]|uniref:hypothetical protein n=1 Tax=Nocardia sp. alder85J TaxID=2862949 RepID=UPI001CD55D44|nr:hypothetical protein [Nocardia sp. alder85J]MCX4097097.1 hypothetical protein [Nocardia sp. alder85J]
MAIENESPSIGNGGENPKSLSHWEIYRAFHPLDTTDGHNAGESYRKIAAGWSDAVRDFGARIQRSSASAWDGPAAQASREAIGNYVARAHDLIPALQALADRVGTAVDSINDTRNTLPEPVSTVPGWDYKGWTVGPLSGSHAKSKIDHARDEAQRVMATSYVAPFGRVDGEIPVLPVPVSPAAPLFEVPAGGPGAGSHDGGTGGGGSAGGGAEPPVPDAGVDQAGQQDDSAAGAVAAQSSGSSAPADGTVAAPDRPAGLPADLSSTRPSGTGIPAAAGGFDGGGPEAGGFGGPGAAGPGLAGAGSSGPGFAGAGPIGPGVAGPGLAGPGVAGPRGAGPGRSVPGVGGGPVAGSRGVSARGGAAAGSPGMGMPGGRGRPEDDDRTRSLPEWLRTEENAAELLGSPPKTLPGGVIGAETDDPPASE